MNIDTFTLECFIAVAETQSFTKASDRVNRTQSAVSQQLSKLEYMLGKTLIIRGKKFSLTEEGEIFYGYAKQIYALHRQAVDRLKEPELAGEVRFGLPEDFATMFLDEVLADFINIHPNILLNIECDLTLNLYERFNKNDFDLVLLKLSSPDDFPNGLEIWSEKLEWVANKNAFNRINLEKALPLVLSPKPCVYRSRAIHALEQDAIKWQLVFSSSSYASKVAAVRAGLGLTVLPKTMIPADLKIIDSATLPSLSDAHISLLKHKTDNHAVSSLEQFIVKRLKH